MPAFKLAFLRLYKSTLYNALHKHYITALNTNISLYNAIMSLSYTVAA